MGSLGTGLLTGPSINPQLRVLYVALGLNLLRSSPGLLDVCSSSTFFVFLLSVEGYSCHSSFSCCSLPFGCLQVLLIFHLLCRTKAHRILHEALRCNFEKWQIWENFALVSFGVCMCVCLLVSACVCMFYLMNLSLCSGQGVLRLPSHILGFPCLLLLSHLAARCKPNSLFHLHDWAIMELVWALYSRQLTLPLRSNFLWEISARLLIFFASLAVVFSCHATHPCQSSWLITVDLLRKTDFLVRFSLLVRLPPSIVCGQIGRFHEFQLKYIEMLC